jgi:hypothetical protein
MFFADVHEGPALPLGAGVISKQTYHDRKDFAFAIKAVSARNPASVPKKHPAGLVSQPLISC